MSQTYVTGFPRIGEKRELKFALEAFWAKKIDFEELTSVAKTLRKRHWNYQKERNIDYISCNDFSFYDIMLDTICLIGAIPPRFANIEDKTQRYFTMARGDENHAAMEMTKWFNTNYHYIVPELHANMSFEVDLSKIVEEYFEAKKQGIHAKVNLIGPITFLALSQSSDGADVFGLFNKVLDAYSQVLCEISALGHEIVVQLDEPIFAKTLEPHFLELLKNAYETLGTLRPNLKLAVVTYFDRANEAIEILGKCPIWAIGLDFVYGEENLSSLLHVKEKTLIAGLIDGRNVWKNNPQKTAALLAKINEVIDEKRIIMATSCSLLHVPYGTMVEEKMDVSIKHKLSFALEKLGELEDIAQNWQHVKNHEQNPSSLIASKASQKFTYTRAPYAARSVIQQYDNAIKEAIAQCVAFQESIGLDVLVHGEFERNDMVEYFGERLEGFAFSEFGWVQSYGSRCVKPPLLHGNVSRKEPLSVAWTCYAQSLTCKPLKGMLTGPVTILNWSFVRDDIPKSEVAYSVARAIAKEIDDLQHNNIQIIQVDEAAFKEGYPLRIEKIKAYEKWAVESFHVAVNTAWIHTQIHTHMCYSNFNDIIQTIEAMDADVITIETARSGNKLLKVFQNIGYKAQIGPGVYDIHSPRVPSVEEMSEQIQALLQVLPKEQLWINPDCGLKTRGWEETKAALINMMKATHLAR